MIIITPEVMSDALEYIAAREADLRNSEDFRNHLWHEVSFHLRQDYRKRVLMKWASDISLQNMYEDPFDYLNLVECSRWEAADHAKRKRIFHRFDGWTLTDEMRYKFFLDFLEEKGNRED